MSENFLRAQSLLERVGAALENQDLDVADVAVKTAQTYAQLAVADAIASLENTLLRYGEAQGIWNIVNHTHTGGV